jgi:hypothetical protein
MEKKQNQSVPSWEMVVWHAGSQLCQAFRVSMEAEAKALQLDNPP